MGKWSLLFDELMKKHDYIAPNPPATQAQIDEIETALRNKPPDDLTELLLEMNGDNWFVFSAGQIIQINLSMRVIDVFMPLDSLLFFAGNGCGDYFGFPIASNGEIKTDCVFLWDHESDSRILKAGGLEEIIVKYYGGET